MLKESIKEFSLDFITMAMSEKEAKKTTKRAEKGKSVEMYEFDLDKLMVREDGTTVLVGEQYYVKSMTSSSTTNGITSSRTDYYYYFNDIIVINIDKEGEIGWATKIHKYQWSANDGGFFSSYFLAMKDNRMFFVFNDDPRNMESTLPSKKHVGVTNKKTVTVLAELDEKGELNKRMLFGYKDKDAGVYLRAKVSQQVAPGTMLLFGQWGKTQRFFRLDL